MAFIITILVATMFPALGLALAVCIGIYKGLVVELQIQTIKQDIREQESPYNIFSLTSWATRF